MKTLHGHTLGSLFRAARKQAKMSTREIAERLGVSYSWVSKVERDVEWPASRTLRTMSKELNVNYDDAVYLADDTRAIGEALARLDAKVRRGQAFKGVILYLTYAGGYYCTFEDYNGVIVKGSGNGIIGAIESAEQQFDDIRRLERMAR